MDKVQIVLKDITTGALDTKITFTNDIFDKDVGKMLDNVINDFNLLSDDNKKAFANILNTYSEYLDELNKYNNAVNSENSLIPPGKVPYPKMGQDTYQYGKDGKPVQYEGKNRYSDNYLNDIVDLNPILLENISPNEIPTQEEILKSNTDEKLKAKVNNYYNKIQSQVNIGTVNDEYGNRIDITIPAADYTSKYDNNPFLQKLYMYALGGQAFTDVHDASMTESIMNDPQKDNNIQKMGTIPISFVTTFISLTAGKIFTSEENKD